LRKFKKKLDDIGFLYAEAEFRWKSLGLPKAQARAA